MLPEKAAPSRQHMLPTVGCTNSCSYSCGDNKWTPKICDSNYLWQRAQSQTHTEIYIKPYTISISISICRQFEFVHDFRLAFRSILSVSASVYACMYVCVFVCVLQLLSICWPFWLLRFQKFPCVISKMQIWTWSGRELCRVWVFVFLHSVAQCARCLPDRSRYTLYRPFRPHAICSMAAVRPVRQALQLQRLTVKWRLNFVQQNDYGGIYACVPSILSVEPVPSQTGGRAGELTDSHANSIASQCDCCDWLNWFVAAAWHPTPNLFFLSRSSMFVFKFPTSISYAQCYFTGLPKASAIYERFVWDYEYKKNKIKNLCLYN